MGIALDKLRSSGYLLEHNFTFLFGDTKNQPKLSTGEAVDLIVNKKVDVIIGPPNSPNTKPVAYLTSFYNVPHLSWVSTGSYLSDKTEFDTLIRVLGTYTKFADALIQLLWHFGWGRVALILRDSGTCSYAYLGIKDKFPKTNITISETITYQTNEINDEEWLIDRLKRVNKRARVFIVCGTNVQIRKLMLKAWDLGMSSPEYVYIGLGAHYERIGIRHWFVENDTRNDEAKDAFKSLLMGGVYSPFLHDTFYLYGRLLHETLLEKGNPNNGRAMFNRSKNYIFKD
ncbi:receptor-type guanylate cyclase gcy-13-like [Tubulanus polymorphus]|uniref:receptor-type guanylate cyclase gcy-13-like n=1 Tax=Tubulanus polymorphus TaxID=672921 RepID=UPI003DA43067